MDRCHRIGQTRPVHVYRLATAKSVEVTAGNNYSSGPEHHGTYSRQAIVYESKLVQYSRSKVSAWVMIFQKLKLTNKC